VSASELLSEKFEEGKADDGGYCSNFKISSGKNIFERRGYASFLAEARALKFSHQKIGIKEKDDESYLDRRSQDIFLHRSLSISEGRMGLWATLQGAMPF
jgi:hypothetical protein